MGYVSAGYVTAGYVESDVAPTPDTPVLVLATIGTAGATMLGSRFALRLAHSQTQAQGAAAGQARGPYGVEPIISLFNHTGQYIFGIRVLDDTLQAADKGRFATLISVDRIEINSAPLSGDVFGGAAATERPIIRAIFDNRDGFWSKLLANEALLCMPMTLHYWYGGSLIVNFFQGEVLRVRLTSRLVVIEWGEG